MKPWQKYYPLTDKNSFICLVDHMGDDSSIVQAARVSYGKDEQGPKNIKEQTDKNRQLIRYLMNHSHTTPFEMVEIKFMVQVPMDCWRQWVRHRTASINEYSTRYTEALDFFQVTDPNEWRLQATDNKQGSSGFLEGTLSESPLWGENFEDHSLCFYDEGYYSDASTASFLSGQEELLHQAAKTVYQNRLKAGVAKEQARKDLPLSTYTRAYWKCDLHNIFNFLRLRMDSHAQLEIRRFANCMFEIVKQICPIACEAFEDYVLNAKKFSRMEMEILKGVASDHLSDLEGVDRFKLGTKPNSMTDREWKAFLGKIS